MIGFLLYCGGCEWGVGVVCFWFGFDFGDGVGVGGVDGVGECGCCGFVEDDYCFFEFFGVIEVCVVGELFFVDVDEVDVEGGVGGCGGCVDVLVVGGDEGYVFVFVVDD